jgi:hypothetical protein
VIQDDSTPVTALWWRQYLLIAAPAVVLLVSFFIARHQILEVVERVMAVRESVDHHFEVAMLLQNDDVVRAAMYFKRAADGGHAAAQVEYARYLINGVGVVANAAEAARYYKMSADQGNSTGQYAYGFCLELGNGVPSDAEEAVKYYKMSADQGNSKGQFR